MGQGVGTWQRDMQPPGGKRNGPALDQQRDEHHHEADVEIDLSFRQPDEQRNRRDEDADGSAQTDPGMNASPAT